MPGSPKSGSESSEVVWLRINITDEFYFEMKACQLNEVE